MSRIDQEARSLLMNRRESLCRHLFEPLPADPVDPVDPVRRELADIEHALRRIDEGQYGSCQTCGGALGMQRIRAIPEARYCVSCSGRRPGAD